MKDVKITMTRGIFFLVDSEIGTLHLSVNDDDHSARIKVITIKYQFLNNLILHFFNIEWR